MNKIKDIIPTEEALLHKISTELDIAFPSFIAETEANRLALKRKLTLLLAGYAPAFLLAFVSYPVLFLVFDETNIQEKVMFIFGIFVFTIFIAVLGIYNGLKWNKTKIAFHQDINEKLAVIVSKILGHSIKYDGSQEQKTYAKNLIKSNNLITELGADVQIDDTYKILHPYPFTVSEFFVINKNNNFLQEQYIGMVAEVHLPKRLEAITMIVSENNTSGLEHTSLSNKLFQTAELKETIVEWNEFEKYLHIATNNELEARYILTPNFMEDLYAWWNKKQEKIKIVFKEDKCFILLPYSKINFGYSNTSIHKVDIQKYLESISYPIWKISLLVEDLRL